MGLFNKSKEVNRESQVQTVKLTDLLASAAVATVQAGASASMEYYKNLCNIGFERYNPDTNTVSGMRTLTFEYPYNGKMEQISVPVLSLVPLTMLQVEDADFNFDVQVADMDANEAIEASVEVVDSTTETTDVLNVNRIPNLRVTLLPSKKTEGAGNSISPSGAGLSVHMTLKQSDMPGGMARFLQVINNLDYRNLPEKPIDDNSNNENN